MFAADRASAATKHIVIIIVAIADIDAGVLARRACK